MPQEFYEEKEAEEILRLATRQSVSGGLSREALLRTAAEVGLTEAQVDAAESHFREESAAQALVEQFRMRQRSKFVQGVLSSAGSFAFLFAIWWMTGHGYFWPGWILVFIAGDILFDEIPKCLIPSSAAYKRAFAKWKERGMPEVDPDEDEEGRRRRRGRRVVVEARVGRDRWR